MLVEQHGQSALSLCYLAPSEVLPFLRQMEETVIFHGLSPVIVYWSTRDTKWLSSQSAKYLRTIRRDASCVSMFSEHRATEQDEFCFLVYSKGISMIVYGHCSDESSSERIYQCIGSIDPHLVKRVFQTMLPQWQFVDFPDANRVSDAFEQVCDPVTAPHFVNGIRYEWTMLQQRAALGGSND